MRVIACRIGEEPIAMEIKNDLKSLQRFVGGYIEILPLTGDIILVCNEEGKIKGLPPNYVYCNRFGDPRDTIVGDFMVCRAGEDGEMISSEGWPDWHLLTVEMRILRKYKEKGGHEA